MTDERGLLRPLDLLASGANLIGDGLHAVVKKDPMSEAALEKHVKELLAGYKVPQAIEFTDELPRNPAGKVLNARAGR